MPNHMLALLSAAEHHRLDVFLLAAVAGITASRAMRALFGGGETMCIDDPPDFGAAGAAIGAGLGAGAYSFDSRAALVGDGGGDGIAADREA